MAQHSSLNHSEEVVWLDGPDGRLFGILHRPATDNARRTCLIMLNSGQISRVGPQRLYVKAARQWAALGFFVLRIDMAGIGDSEAENPVIHFDNHSPAEAATAVRYVRTTLQVDNVVLQGLCAGARAALKCAMGPAQVDAVLSWSCPVFSAADGMPESPEESAGRMSTPRARDSVGRIGGALARMRFLSGYWWRNRLRYGWAEMGELGRALWQIVRGERQATGYFLQSTDRYLEQGRPVLFVYGERDRISLVEFKDRFPSIPENADEDQAYCVIPGATHTFNSLESQTAVIEISTAWLQTKFSRQDRPG